MPTTRAAVYTRVSTQEQERGFSLRGQYDDCRSYAERHEYRVVRRFEDVASGRTLDRPGFRALVDAAVADRFDVLVVWRRDRFGRDAVHNGFFDRLLASHGVRIEAVQTGPREANAYTRFVDRLFDAVDELEAERISERCQMGRETAARAGVWPTRPIYGYIRKRRKGPLEPDPAKAHRVVHLFTRVAAGASLRVVAREVGAHHSTLVYRLRNPAYKGAATYAGIPVEGVPALVTTEVWAAANRRLDTAAEDQGHPPSRGRQRSAWHRQPIKVRLPSQTL